MFNTKISDHLPQIDYRSMDKTSKDRKRQK